MTHHTHVDLSPFDKIYDAPAERPAGQARASGQPVDRHWATGMENLPHCACNSHTDANEIMASVHNRMPVFCHSIARKQCLSPGGVPFFNPFPAERTRAITGAIILAAVLGCKSSERCARTLLLQFASVTGPTQETASAGCREADHSIAYERRTEAAGCDLPLEQELRRSPSCLR